MFRDLFKKSKYLKYAPTILLNFKNLGDVFSLIFGAKKSSETGTVVKLRSGERFQVGHYLDLLTVSEVFLGHEYDTKLLHPHVIVDIGANIGTFSVLSAKLHPQATIYAFEPAPATFKHLKKNLELNGVKNVIASDRALSAKTETRQFFQSNSSGLSSFHLERKGGTYVNVECISFADLMREKNIEKIDYLKMDCEGAEYEILMDCPSEVLQKIKNIVLEYHNGITKFNHHDLLTFLKTQGFQVKSKRHAIENDIGLIHAWR